MSRDEDFLESSGSNKAPHYALPNVAQVLPQYANEEADMIRQAFQPGNFRSITKLPNDLRFNSINEMKNNAIDNNLASSTANAPYGSYKTVGRTTYFSAFEYQGSDYGLLEELRKETRGGTSELKEGQQDFLPSSAAPPELQNQATFLHTRTEEDIKTLLAKGGEDSLDQHEDILLRMKWLEESKILHGPFRPGGVTKSSSTVHKGNIPDIIQSIAKELASDWSDCDFDIYSDTEDLIVVEFALNTLENPKGLLAYMNMMSKNNPAISSHGLTKVVELWNHEPGDGNCYYSFKPPWVRRRIVDPYYTLHPEAKDVRSSRLQATKKKEKRRLEAEQEAARHQAELQRRVATAEKDASRKKTYVGDYGDE